MMLIISVGRTKMQRRNEDIYKIFHGMTPLKRGERRKGQSEYYYLDPRGAETFSDMKTIDVESEDTPNPKIKAILNDDLHKNPQDYYIWRTKGDDKVRDRHKERDGKVFNWHIPPEGGHPGEDYNCRCWAEPYVPKIAEKLNITPKFDLSGLPQYAANDKAIVVSDTVYKKKPLSNNELNDEEIILRNIPLIIKEEGIVDYPYKDTKGYITVGAGLNIDDYEVFCNMPWLNSNNEPASTAEIRQNYQNLVPQPKGKLPVFYKKYTSIHLSGEIIFDKIKRHLKNDLSFIKDNIDEFYRYPPAIQDVFIDFQYNTGNCLQFVRFREGAKAKKLDKMLEESFRSDVGKSRNESIRQRLKSNKDWDY